MSQAHTILYLCHHPWTWNSRRKLAGVRRFASSRGWNVEPFPPEESRPEHIRALLAEHQPIGCIVDRAGAGALERRGIGCLRQCRRREIRIPRTRRRASRRIRRRAIAISLSLEQDAHRNL